MNGISPWQAAASAELSNDNLPLLFNKSIGLYSFSVYCSPSALYIRAEWPNGDVAFRAAYSPEVKLKVVKKNLTVEGIDISMRSIIGTFKTKIKIIAKEHPILKFTTFFVPETDMHIPFWPRDIIFPGNKNRDKAMGTVHVKQVGTRSGIVHFSLESGTTAAYFIFRTLPVLPAITRTRKHLLQRPLAEAGQRSGFLFPLPLIIR